MVKRILGAVALLAVVGVLRTLVWLGLLSEPEEVDEVDKTSMRYAQQFAHGELRGVEDPDPSD